MLSSITTIRKTSGAVLALFVISFIAIPIFAYADPATPVSQQHTYTIADCVQGSLHYSILSGNTCSVKLSDNSTGTLNCPNSGDAKAASSCILTNASGQIVAASTMSAGYTSTCVNGQGCTGSSPILDLIKWLSGGFLWLIFKVISGVVLILVEVTLGLLMLTGIIFNVVVSNLVIGMGQYINSTEGAAAIQAAWTTIRDLANIAIIGGFITVGIGTILQTQNYGANKLLAKLIVAALLVNFSYFFAGAIIDASNYLSGQIYQNVICSTQSSTNCSNVTIAGTFQDITDIQWSKSLGFSNALGQLGQAANKDSAGELAASGANDLISSILLLIMILVTIFVFLSAIALLVGRFTALILLLITSPLGIAGTAIPVIDRYAKQWWGILFSQAFFAPVYFLLVGISLQVVGALKKTFISSTTVSSSSVASIGGTFILFVTATVFMIASLRAAKKMSESGKDYFGEIYAGAQKTTAWMPNLYKFGLRTAGTETYGRAGDKFSRWYAEKFAPRRWAILGNKQFSEVPVLASLDRRIQKGAENMRAEKFGGKESYADTKTAREAREVEMTENLRDLEQEKNADKASEIVDERQKRVSTLVQNAERKVVRGGGDIDNKKEGSGAPPTAPKTPGTSGPSGTGGASTAPETSSGDGAPNGIGTTTTAETPNAGDNIEESENNAPGVASSGSNKTGEEGDKKNEESSKTTGPAEESVSGSPRPKLSGTGSEEKKQRESGTAHTPIQPLTVTTGTAQTENSEGKSAITTEIRQRTLNLHRGTRIGKDGKPRSETDAEVLKSLEVGSIDAVITKDPETGEYRPMTGKQAHDALGERVKMTVVDVDAEGNAIAGTERPETSTELSARLNGRANPNTHYKPREP